MAVHLFANNDYPKVGSESVYVFLKNLGIPLSEENVESIFKSSIKRHSFGRVLVNG